MESSIALVSQGIAAPGRTRQAGGALGILSQKAGAGKHLAVIDSLWRTCYNNDVMFATRTNPGNVMILVSACLLGIPCRYDAQSCPDPNLYEPVTQGRVAPICPEVAGGLPTPRLPAEIEGGHTGLDGEAVLAGRTRVVRCDGVDVTAQFIAGAQEALALARRLGVRDAILKANSPSCGAGLIHDGTFSGRLVAGDGVTAALLKGAGVRVSTEKDL